jgi:hypothetical protein
MQGRPGASDPAADASGYQTFRLAAGAGRGTGRTTGRMCRCGTVRAEVIMGRPSHRAARPPMGLRHISRWGCRPRMVGSAASRPSDEPRPRRGKPPPDGGALMGAEERGVRRPPPRLRRRFPALNRGRVSSTRGIPAHRSARTDPRRGRRPRGQGDDGGANPCVRGSSDERVALGPHGPARAAGRLRGDREAGEQKRAGGGRHWLIGPALSTSSSAHSRPPCGRAGSSTRSSRLLAAIFLLIGLAKLVVPRRRVAAGPMRWAADVTDNRFRTLGPARCPRRRPGDRRHAQAARRLGLALTMVGAIATHVRVREASRPAVGAEADPVAAAVRADGHSRPVAHGWVSSLPQQASATALPAAIVPTAGRGVRALRGRHGVGPVFQTPDCERP